MRCLNCHTVMAASDAHCPSCGMALTMPERGWVHAYTYGGAPPATPKGALSRFTKWILLMLALPVGGFLLLGGIAFFVEKPEPPPPPRTLSAAELAQLKDLRQLDDEWVVYEAPSVIETQVQIVSGIGRRQTRTRLILVPVQDRWLIAQVPPGFSGTRLEGRLQHWDSPLYNQSVGKVRAQFREQAPRLLTFQLNAETDRATENNKDNRLLAGTLVVVGGLILAAGLKVALVPTSGAVAAPQQPFADPFKVATAAAPPRRQPPLP